MLPIKLDGGWTLVEHERLSPHFAARNRWDGLWTLTHLPTGMRAGWSVSRQELRDRAVDLERRLGLALSTTDPIEAACIIDPARADAARQAMEGAWKPRGNA